MANSIPTQSLPTEKDFGVSLDAKCAWKNFGGLDLDSACELFCKNPGCYQEDFMFMETAAFEFYFPVIDRFLRENRSDELFDDSVAWILGRGVLLQMSVPISRDLLKQIKFLCVYVRAHLSQYSPLPVEQGEIDDTWLEIEQRILELDGANTVK